MDEKLYSCADLIMRCDLNEPFSGAIDDGKGTIAYINTELFVNEYTEGSCVYYEKLIMLRINKVTHIVRKGDSLGAIAKKLNVSVDEIAKSNGVKNADFIKVGDVLNINVDIRYGYQVSGMVDTLCFSPQAREYGYNRLSETVLYGTLDKANAIADNLGLSLVKNAGKTRVGSNFHVYAENPSGRVFRGNQHVTTHGLKDIGKSITKYTQPKIGRLAMPLAVAIEGVEVYDGWQQDGQTFGHNTQKQIIGATGGIAGGWAGALAGAKATGAAGALLGPIGGLVGLVIGGFIGGYFGAKYSEEGVEFLYDEMKNK